MDLNLHHYLTNEEKCEVNSLKSSFRKTDPHTVLTKNSFQESIEVILKHSRSPSVRTNFFLYECGIFPINDGYAINMLNLKNLLDLPKSSVLHFFKQNRYYLETSKERLSEIQQQFEDKIGAIVLKICDIRQWSFVLRKSMVKQIQATPQESDYESDLRNEYFHVEIPV